MRRLVSAVLWLYPRPVRVRHGAELESLVEELIARDGASTSAVVTRLAADGLSQRLMSRATVWLVLGTLLVSSAGSLAVSDLATASARPRTAHPHTHRGFPQPAPSARPHVRARHDARPGRGPWHPGRASGARAHRHRPPGLG
ncbi:MAG TPA: hypothetical protein VFN48_02375 [Solirubrobacteraceae bacterium]|nr:hypothetical protein [Solirubrobacteraceae bacterium]